MDKQAKNALKSSKRARRGDDSLPSKTWKKNVTTKVERVSATTGPSENSGSPGHGEFEVVG